MRVLIVTALSVVISLVTACSSQQGADETAESGLPTLESISAAGHRAADKILDKHKVKQTTNEHLKLTGTQSSMIELGLSHAKNPLALARNNADMICRYELDYRRGIEMGSVAHGGANYYGECATITNELLK